MPDKRKIQRFHALLRDTGTLENKGIMVGSFGKKSTKDLTNEEIDSLITTLEAMKGDAAGTPKQLRRARSTVLTLLTEVGIMRHPKDWENVNAYLEQPRIFGKRLNDTTSVDETKALARKLRAIKKKIEEARQREDYIASQN